MESTLDTIDRTVLELRGPAGPFSRFHSSTVHAHLFALHPLLQELDSPVDRDKFQTMIPAMLQTVAHVLNAGEEIAAQEALELFIDLAENQPRFLRRHLVEVATAMLQVWV
jgi:importin-5